ncbi:Ribosomal protein L37, mitochondrial, partial [Cynara cardunculus var. scolymus]
CFKLENLISTAPLHIVSSIIVLSSSSLPQPLHILLHIASSTSAFSTGLHRLLCNRTFAVGGKSKKGKGGGAADAPKQSSLSKEVKSTTVVGANILKEGTDPKILADSEYPEWLFHLLDKKPALSELRRKNIETLPYEDLKRFVKLDNRSRIKENNSTRAKN